MSEPTQPFQQIGDHTEGEGKISFLDLVKREAAASANEAWKANEERMRQEVIGYARDTGIGMLTGKGQPNLLPDVIAVTATGKELTIASAKNRSWRTFVQGFGIDLGFALISVLALALGNFDFLDGAAWATLAVLVLKTIIQTAISYIARMQISPNYDKNLESLPSTPPVPPWSERAAS
jgi:hypothetical protein